MSFKVYALAPDNSGKWVSNDLRFLTVDEAAAYATITYGPHVRIVACSDPVNYTEPGDEPQPNYDDEKGD